MLGHGERQGSKLLGPSYKTQCCWVLGWCEAGSAASKAQCCWDLLVGKAQRSHGSGYTIRLNLIIIFLIYIYIYIYIYILKIISKYQKNINVKLKKIKKISILSHVGQQYPTLLKYLLECHFQAFLVLCKPAGSRSKKALDPARGKTQRWWVLQG